MKIWRRSFKALRKKGKVGTSDDFEVGVALYEVGGHFKHSEVQVGGRTKGSACYEE